MHSQRIQFLRNMNSQLIDYTYQMFNYFLKSLVEWHRSLWKVKQKFDRSSSSTSGRPAPLQGDNDRAHSFNAPYHVFMRRRLSEQGLVQQSIAADDRSSRERLRSIAAEWRDLPAADIQQAEMAAAIAQRQKQAAKAKAKAQAQSSAHNDMAEDCEHIAVAAPNFGWTPFGIGDDDFAVQLDILTTHLGSWASSVRAPKGSFKESWNEYIIADPPVQPQSMEVSVPCMQAGCCRYKFRHAWGDLIRMRDECHVFVLRSAAKTIL